MTWERRDLPLLQVLASGDDEQVHAGYLHIGHSDVGERLGLELDDYEIHDALAALWDAGYVDFNRVFERAGAPSSRAYASQAAVGRTIRGSGRGSQQTPPHFHARPPSRSWLSRSNSRQRRDQRCD
jgi:hypothetical protein